MSKGIVTKRVSTSGGGLARGQARVQLRRQPMPFQAFWQHAELPLEPPPALDRLKDALAPLRRQVIEHRIYAGLRTISDLRLFMEHHVFAVWDFMSLLKALQRCLTCVAVPWVPEGDPRIRRFVNEIVLEEESDEINRGYVSHLELYCEAMEQCGANTMPIGRFIHELRGGRTVREALEAASVPKPACTFVKANWQILASRAPHRIAAVFVFSREEVIPDMFRALAGDLHTRFPDQVDLFATYLERHVSLDETRHGPLALQVLVGLCGSEQDKWREAEAAARLALQARLALWNSVAERMG